MPNLDPYRNKRDFARTQEPSGAAGGRSRQSSRGGLRYVIQKHAARRLHYDFRLELDGVLLSWAVPKGPSLDPEVKRLAQQTEPHPLEYADFEGTIPKGQYGGGTVMIWDQGTWVPEGDPSADYTRGRLTFRLSGEKLRGRWHLVRTRAGKDERGWLLFKARDENARSNGEIVEALPNSAQSGRDLEAIAKDAESKPPKNRTPAAKGHRDPSPSAAAPPLPVEPELATLVDAPPEGADWIHEVKFDGYRILSSIEKGNVRLFTRAGNDWTARLSGLLEPLQQLDLESALIDGEIVSLDARGLSDFQKLQNALGNESDPDLVYYVFDLLWLDGRDLRRLPLLERKRLLSEKVGAGSPRLRMSQHVRGEVAGAPRRSQARSVHWVKPELVAQVAFTGFTDEGIVRHPTFRGLREDKPPAEVTMERPASSYPLTHPDKILYPEQGITKVELFEYYQRVADLILPEVAGRPLTLVRCPDGRGKPCFFQKHPGKGVPGAIRSVAIREKEGKAPYAVVDDAEGLFGLVQLGALEIHTWGSRAADPEHPDRIVFDLDPDPSVPFPRVIEAALRLREIFDSADLESFVKTTGGKGLHVCVPIEPDLGWDTIKDFTSRIAHALAAEAPDRYVATQSKAKRRGKIFIDYLRNGRGATFIAPYSTRARENAPIALPLEWEELTPELAPDRITVRNIEQWLAEHTTSPLPRMNQLQQELRPNRLGGQPPAPRTSTSRTSTSRSSASRTKRQ